MPFSFFLLYPMWNKKENFIEQLSYEAMAIGAVFWISLYHKMMKIKISNKQIWTVIPIIPILNWELKQRERILLNNLVEILDDIKCFFSEFVYDQNEKEECKINLSSSFTLFSFFTKSETKQISS